MNPDKIAAYRRTLVNLGRRVRATSEALEEAARAPTSGEAGGSLSNAPMHLADVASEVYTQELNATLLENEDFIRGEVIAALDRIDRGAFGTCEECGQAVPEARLDAMPYARYCVGCSEKLDAGSDANLNTGRPAGWGSTLEHPAALAGQRRSGEQSPTTAPRHEGAGDGHAAGTPGGGTAVGGLAGTNVADGDPDGAGLEDAMGSGSFDSRDGEADPGDGYAGPGGGAVGGSPANKRSSGGKTHGGLAPQLGRGDSATP